MNSRLIDWIWHVRGSLSLAPGQSGAEAFDRLDPLFRQAGTSHERTNDTLTFRKKDQAAQDRMSVFDGGVLRIENGRAGSVLHYHLTSRALLCCFLAPLLFLAFAQLTVALGKLEKPPAEASDASKKGGKKDADMPMNPIDKALGAPAPEKPAKGEKDGEKARDGDKSHSPTAAYVFAAIFAVLYLVGRILESRLVRTLFRKSLLGA
ncbi:hypothetical protein WBP07_28225 [Novosphingobium sp. BL-8A]|uniref:hypothetical protein n=1 Tax=Novosphingobium sp. BL-8A TaxID=3127639 RepID=UPI0037576993